MVHVPGLVYMVYLVYVHTRKWRQKTMSFQAADFLAALYSERPKAEGTACPVTTATVPPNVDSSKGSTIDADLLERLAHLTPSELAAWRTCWCRRIARREPPEPAKWRALVDVRLMFGHWPKPDDTTQPEACQAQNRPESPRHAWPGALADWVLLLEPDDLPDRFVLRPGVRVVDRTRFLNRLRNDIQQGPSGPRARFGGLQRDLLNLHAVLLGGQATARGD